MNIHEALKKAMDGALITREAYKGHMKIYPTDTPDCTIVITDEGASVRWQPKRDDLMATDWEVILERAENEQHFSNHA